MMGLHLQVPAVYWPVLCFMLGDWQSSQQGQEVSPVVAWPWEGAAESKYGQGYRVVRAGWNLHLVWLQSAGAGPQFLCPPWRRQCYRRIHLIGRNQRFVVPEGWLKVIIWSPSKLSSGSCQFYLCQRISNLLLGKATALVQAASFPPWSLHELFPS